MRAFGVDGMISFTNHDFRRIVRDEGDTWVSFAANLGPRNAHLVRDEPGNGGRRYAQMVHGSVTVHMNASVEKFWSLISDVTQIGRFSPETFEAEWLGGITAPAEGA